MHLAAASGAAPPAADVDHGLRRRHRLAVAALTAVAATIYAAYSIIKHRNFGTTIFDTVIFDQAVRGYAQFERPVSIALGVHNGYGYEFSVLGDHFSPIIALLAPLYWIHDGPITLFVAQAVLFALAIPPLWVFTRRVLGTVAAYLVSIGYGLSWEIQTAVAFDFHEAAFAPVLMAVMFERAQAGRRGWAVAAAAALLLVKEDMGLAVAGFGLYLLAVRSWRLGAACVLGGVGFTWAVTRFLIPFFGGTPNARWHYGALGENVPSAALYVLANPVETLQIATDPAVKVHTLLWIFAPVLFLALLSPMVAPALPLLAERMLATGMETWWGIWWQYDAFVVIPVFCAAVDGAARLRRRLRLPGTGLAWAGAVCAISIAVLPRFPLSDLWRFEWYGGGPRVDAQRAAVARVPDGALVAADNHIGPHLSARARVLLFDTQPRKAAWVVADVREWHFPFPSLQAQRRRVGSLTANGYEVVFQREGVIVLHANANGAAHERERERE